MTLQNGAAALALMLACIAWIPAASAEDTYVITEFDDDVEDHALVVLCKADVERCRQLLAERMDQLRQMLEAERAKNRRGAVPELPEAATLAQALTARLTSEGTGPSPATRLAWLAHRYRWVHPIPPVLEAAVTQAWSSPYLTGDDRDVLADAAMTLGHADALDVLVARLSGPGPAPVQTVVGAPPPADWLLRRHTDAPRQTSSATVLAQWFESHRGGLRFDPFLRRWRATD